ncbi:CHAT domain protein [Ceratobasidium sp. AG-Ba]|nr:CHAT domain protein [Ceratobasidium sp. AG-Ba]
MSEDDTSDNHKLDNELTKDTLPMELPLFMQRPEIGILNTLLDDLEHVENSDEFSSHIRQYLSDIRTPRSEDERADQLISIYERGLETLPKDHDLNLFLLSYLWRLRWKRFNALKQLADLNRLIEYDHQIIEFSSTDHLNRRERLFNLGQLYEKRFALLESRSDLEESLNYRTQAVELTPDNDPAKPSRMVNLGVSHHSYFERFGEATNLRRAIEHISNALGLLSDAHPDKASYLSKLAFVHRTSFQRYHKLEDLQEAIDSEIRAIELAPGCHSKKSEWLNSLGVSYILRFQHLGELADLEQAIDKISQAVSLVSDNPTQKSGCLQNLAQAYNTRYERTRDGRDLDKSVEVLLQASALMSGNDSGQQGAPNRPTAPRNTLLQKAGSSSDPNVAIETGSQPQSVLREIGCAPQNHINLYKLAQTYNSKFGLTGKIEDLDLAINKLLEATSKTADDEVERITYLYNLGIWSRLRFERFGEVQDIHQAVIHLKEAVALSSGNPLKHAESLHGLGCSHQTRFEQLGDPEDLILATRAFTEAVQLTPDADAEMPKRLSSLAVSYQTRFESLGDAKDLEAAIKMQLEATNMTLDSDENKPTALSNLSVAYMSRFQRYSHLVDVDKGIECLIRALELSPAHDEKKRGYLTNLGLLYFLRFDRLGELDDIDNAIERQNQSLILTAESDPEKAIRWSHLGVFYHFRFERFGSIDDINRAIEYQTNSVISIRHGHASRPKALNNLGNSYQCRFEHLGQTEDVDAAIEYLRQAVDLTPESHPLFPWWLNNLSRPYYERFKRLGRTHDLDEAIGFQKNALLLTPSSYAYVPRQLERLGILYKDRFDLSGHPEDIEHAIYYTRLAATSTGHATTRLKASRSWAKLCISQHISPLEAYAQALQLIPEIVWLGNSINKRYSSLLSDIQDLAMEAAAVAINHHNYQLALEWLEEGRSIVWNQILQLRTPFEALVEHSPSLAVQLKKVAEDLERTNAITESPESALLAGVSIEQSSREHRRLADTWEKLLSDVRSIPALQNFLKPRKFDQLALSSSTGTVVVVINVYRERCDALAVVPGSSSVIHIPLPSLSFDDLVMARDMLSHVIHPPARGMRRPVFEHFKPHDPLKEVLQMLWTYVVQPILDSLGYTVPGKPIADMPHITWCATGPLAFLPLHAAGRYEEPRAKVFDFVVSSYSPTLSALLPPENHSPSFCGILAVSETAANTSNPLPGTITEVDQLELKAKGIAFTRLDGQKATCEAVLDGIEHHSWLHLACHASQNIADPTASALQLHDGPLRLLDITRKSRKHTEFAFLSACETATGDQKMPDEAVHLAAGMMMAGYRSVVATMWSISDRDAPLVAQKLYAQLLQGGEPQCHKAARALHESVACLRDTLNDTELERWVPYIHMGSSLDYSATIHDQQLVGCSPIIWPTLIEIGVDFEPTA